MAIVLENQVREVAGIQSAIRDSGQHHRRLHAGSRPTTLA